MFGLRKQKKRYECLYCHASSDDKADIKAHVIYAHRKQLRKERNSTLKSMHASNHIVDNWR